MQRFTEKSDVLTAESLIAEGALWDGGVFAFRLCYIMDVVNRTTDNTDFVDMPNQYATLSKISFDYVVVEKTQSIAVVPYSEQ